MSTAGDIYGRSLYDLAVEEGLDARILEELEALARIFAQNPDYITLLSEPSIPKRERLSLIDEALGGQVHEYVESFLKILTERGIAREFPACVRRYRAGYNEDHGIAEAVVTSAVALSEGELSRLRARLEEISGKEVILRQRTDASVLGGLSVELAGQSLDGTLRGRLAGIRRSIGETVL